MKLRLIQAYELWKDTILIYALRNTSDLIMKTIWVMFSQE